MMTFAFDLTECADGVLLLRFTAAELDPSAHHAITRALLQANDRPDCRVLVLAGAGARFAVDAGREPHDDGDRSEEMMLRRLPASRHLTIAAVNGLAAGSGLAIALGADVRITGPEAQFQFSGAWIRHSKQRALLLGQCLAPARALEFAMSPRTLDAAGAVELGLARLTLPAEDFLQEACAWAQQLTAQASGDASQLRNALWLASGRPRPGPR